MAVIFPEEIHPKHGLIVRLEHFARPLQYLMHFHIVEVYPSCRFIPLDLPFNNQEELNEYLYNRGIIYKEFTVTDNYPYIKEESYFVDARKIYEVEESISKYLTNYKYYSINEVGEILSFSRPTIYKFIKDGNLNSIRINGQMRIKHSDLIEFINKENQT